MMEIITLFVSFIGLFCGTALAYIAPEEMAKGKKYFLMLRKFFFVVSILIACGYLFNNKYDIIGVFLFGIMMLITYLKDSIGDIITYIVFAIVFYISTSNINLLLVESSLIFLYGLPMGSLIVFENKKSKKEIIKIIFKRYCYFLIVGILLLLIG